ncbi:MAG: glycosyltransferase family 1 protein [Candidatus Paceibacterota bacterium]|jgi:glycosyltransferase involved in cell wall biosynthesis
MKIAYFIGTLKKEDGVTRVLLALIREAQKKRVEPIIITGWAEDSSISSVLVVQVPSIVFPLYKEYKLPLPGIRGFEKVLNEFKPDIIHIHSPDTIAWAALKYAKKYKIPIVATFHTDFDKYLIFYHLSFLRPLLWFIFKRLYRQMNFVTTPSQIVSQELIDHNIPNVYTIPWGVEYEWFNISFRSLDWRYKILNDKKENIILCVCRLAWEKDLRTLAQIYNLLRKYQNNFSMIVVGDGPARQKLESLMPDTIFMGHLEGLELSKVYASCDIFLFPSSTETFGNVTIEAMASGLVSVVAEAGGSMMLIKNGENGFLAKPNNVRDFYDKVSLLLNNEELKKRMQNNGLNRVKNFTWQKVFDDLLQKYLELLTI